MQRAGQDADNAAPGTMDDAATAFGQRFDDLTSRNVVNVDPDLRTGLTAAQRDYGRVLPSQQRAVVDNVIDDILANPQMSGAAYQEARSRLTRAGTSYRQNDPALSEALFAVRNALDEAATRSISPADSAAWHQLRGEYRNYAAIRNAMKSGDATTTAGNIAPSRLGVAIRAQEGQRYARGQHALSDLERIGQQFVRDKIPNSGTAERLLTGGALAGGAVIEPTTAAVALTAPPLVQALMNSRAGRAYLSNQAAPPMDPETRRQLISAILSGQTLDRISGRRNVPANR